MVLGKLPVPGLLTYLDNSRARAYWACSRCRSGLFGHFFSRLSSLLFLPLSGRRPIQTEIFFQRAVKPKTNQPETTTLLFIVYAHGCRLCSYAVCRGHKLSHTGRKRCSHRYCGHS